jgi:uncharacterized membrane protein YcaP (DUF421 family)
MFDMQHPWWEFVVRAAAVYLFLLVMVRITGKRTVGQFTPFDLIVVMLLAEATSSSLNAGDESLQSGLIAAATLIALNLLIATVTSRSQKADAVLQGKPILIGRDGVIYKDVLRSERVSESDFEQALRESDCTIEEMRMAVLEADGKISILKAEQAKPATAPAS